MTSILPDGSYSLDILLYGLGMRTVWLLKSTVTAADSRLTTRPMP